MGNGNSHPPVRRNPSRVKRPMPVPPSVNANPHPRTHPPPSDNYPGHDYNYPTDYYGNYPQHYPQLPMGPTEFKGPERTHHHHHHRHRHSRDRHHHHHHHHHRHVRNQQQQTYQDYREHASQTTPTLILGDKVNEGPRSTPVFLRESSSSDSFDEQSIFSTVNPSATVRSQKPSSSVAVQKPPSTVVITKILSPNTNRQPSMPQPTVVRSPPFVNTTVNLNNRTQLNKSVRDN